MFSRISVKYQIALSILLVSAITFGFVLWRTIHASFINNQNHLIAKQDATVQLLSRAGRTALLTSDFSELQIFFDNAVKDPRVQQVSLSDHSGKIMASTNTASIGLKPFLLDDNQSSLWHHKSIENSAGLLGTLHIKFSDYELRQNYLATKQWAIAIGASGVAIMAMLGLLLGYALTRRLEKLTVAAGKVVNGDFSFRTKIRGKDEIARLANVISIMTDKLFDGMEELEQKVDDRTLELRRLNSTLYSEIKEREYVENQLREANAFLDSIIENLPNLLFVKDAENLRFLRFNRAGEKLLGFKREDILGKNDYDFFSKHEADFFVQKDREALNRNEVVDIPEEQIKTKDNGTRVLHTKKIPVFSGNGKARYLLGISEDITERKKTELALKKSEAHYRAIVEDQTELICRWLPDGTLTFVNEAFCRYFVKRREYLIGKSFRPLMPQEDISLVERHKNSLRNGVPVVTYQHRVLMPNGQTRWQQWTNRAILDSSNNVIEYQAVGRDITEQRHAEEALLAKNEELKSFTYIVSHDLKGPLRGIVSYARELSKRHSEPLCERGHFCVEQVVTATLELDRLLEDLLSYSRAETAKQSSNEVNVEELIQQILRDRNDLLKENSTVLKIDFNFRKLNCWERGLTQILSNLIDNAIKFSKKATPPKLEIIGRENEQEVHIHIRDNGIGFDMKYHDRIFGIFNRLVPYEEYQGTGVGLAIVKKLTEKQNGKIWALSAPGKGATFFVSLPKHAMNGIDDVAKTGATVTH